MRDSASGNYDNDDNDGGILELFDGSLDEFKGLVSNYSKVIDIVDCYFVFLDLYQGGTICIVKVLWLDQHVAIVVLIAMNCYCRPLELKQVHTTTKLNLA